ncbi:Ribonuclease III [uncultured virus]|nr:Ribonuclease III [uncultured virus]
MDPLSHYYERLRAFLRDSVLSPIQSRTGQISIIPPAMVDDFYSDANMEILATAFTHLSFDYLSNYESKEFLGDQVLNTCTSKKLITKFPDADQEQLSNMLGVYKSNDIWQHMMARLKGVKEFIRMGAGLVAGDDEIADVFEALFGAVYLVAEKVVPGMGDSICRNLYEKFFHNFYFDKKHMAGNPKTVFWQMFEGSRFDSKKKDDIAIETPPKRKNKGQNVNEEWRGDLTVTFTELLRAYLNEVLPGKNNNWSKMVFRAQAANRGTASTKVYDEVVAYLADGGMTPEFAGFLRVKKSILDSGFEREFEQKRRDQKIDRVFFEKTKSSARDGIIIHYLIGVYLNGEKKVLGKTETSSSSTTHPQARTDLIAKFLGIAQPKPSLSRSALPVRTRR